MGISEHIVLECLASLCCFGTESKKTTCYQFWEGFVTLKVIFCWTDISGYMAACWRALHQSSEIDLFVLAFQARTETAFADQLMDGLPCYLLDQNERHDETLIQTMVQSEQPDVVVLCGWLHSAYRQLVTHPSSKDIAFVMGMDTPWWDTWKQKFAPLALRSYLSHIDRVVVTGERSWQYARRLGFSSSTIMRGMYGIDFDAWSPLLQQRQAQPWPRSFLFVGRYVQVKAIDVLIEAYRAYRNQVQEPWPLVCCGQGDLAIELEDQPGIVNRGFVQPQDMPSIWRDAGALILPSRFDPWPLVIVEAAASGLPIVCTEVCGSSVEVIRPWYNGLLVPEDHVAALTKALLTMHQNYDNLSEWGSRSQQLAAPYAASVWVRRWHTLLHEVSGSKSLSSKDQTSTQALSTTSP